MSEGIGFAGLQMVLATANPDKAAEIRAIMAEVVGAQVVLLARPAHIPEVAETGTTLKANARLKARALCVATGLPALADDTGLEVEALGGDPGVYSARFAGEGASYTDNVTKLLAELDPRGASSPVDRRARFRTVALAAFPDGSEMVATGEVTGEIAAVPRGKGGFGYDPVFVPDEGDGRTFAEMTSDEKDASSHRGRAFRALAVMLTAR